MRRLALFCAVLSLLLFVGGCAPAEEGPADVYLKERYPGRSYTLNDVGPGIWAVTFADAPTHFFLWQDDDGGWKNDCDLQFLRHYWAEFWGYEDYNDFLDGMESGDEPTKLSPYSSDDTTAFLRGSYYDREGLLLCATEAEGFAAFLADKPYPCEGTLLLTYFSLWDMGEEGESLTTPYPLGEVAGLRAAETQKVANLILDRRLDFGELNPYERITLAYRSGRQFWVEERKGERTFYGDLILSEGGGISIATLYEILNRGGWRVYGTEDDFYFVGWDRSSYWFSEDFQYEDEEGEWLRYYTRNTARHPFPEPFVNHISSAFLWDMTGIGIAPKVEPMRPGKGPWGRSILRERDSAK